MTYCKRACGGNRICFLGHPSHTKVVYDNQGENETQCIMFSIESFLFEIKKTHTSKGLRDL